MTALHRDRALRPPRVLAIVGSTAAGKTSVGEAVAAAIGGEIVCADSRQVFAELEIGTGKPSPAERARLPHHLFELHRLGESPSAGGWARAAGTAIDAIHARGAVPVVVGGTGLYVRALQHGLAPAPPRDPEVRARLAAEARALGAAALHDRLAEIDPETAARLEPNDAQRIVRALEVHSLSGRPLAWWHRERPGTGHASEWRVLELVLDPAELTRRIAVRARDWFAGGLIEETEALAARGLEPALRELRAVGYDEALDLLTGHLTRAQAEERAVLRTRQLAKRQRTWFRHQIEADRRRADGEEVGGRWIDDLRRLGFLG